MDGYSGVSRSYSSFMPSYCGAKILYFPEGCAFYRTTFLALARTQNLRFAHFLCGAQEMSKFLESTFSSVLGHRHHRLRCVPLTRFHSKIVGHQMPGRGGRLAVGHRGIGAFFDFGDQIVLDPEHDIGIKVLVALDKDVGDQRLVARRIDKKMHMRRTHRMTPRLQDHFPDGTVGRDRITAGQDGAEEKPAVGVGDEPRPR